MFPSFDVFQIDEHGRVVWKGFVESLLAARATIQNLMQASPSDYLILDQSSGQRIVVPKPPSKQPESSCGVSDGRPEAREAARLYLSTLSAPSQHLQGLKD
jgi:hypothetical protein